MQNKLKGLLAFCIGIFGAMAILGVFFKIMKYDNYELFMKVGFMGEAAAFVTMGILELASSFGAQASQYSPANQANLVDGMPITTSFVKAVEAKLDAQLDIMLTSFSGEVEQLGVEMRALGAEMEHSRSSVRHMRTQLDAVATGDLAGDASRLGEGMASLGHEMAQAGTVVESMRDDLETMAARFHNFNGTTHMADRSPVMHRAVGQ